MFVFSLYKCERIPFWQVRVTIFLSLSTLSTLSLWISFDSFFGSWRVDCLIISVLYSFITLFICYLLFVILVIENRERESCVCVVLHWKVHLFLFGFFWQLVRIWLLAASWALCLYNNVKFLSVVWMCRSWGFVVKRAGKRANLVFLERNN